MAAPTRLSIYKGACLALAQSPIDSLSEDLEIKHLLDAVWDRNGIKTCLQQGLWNFALRTSAIEYEAAITPEFGPRYAFTKPSDLCALNMLSSDPYFYSAYRNYRDENGYWWADITPIYVSYVSDDSLYGLDFSVWPENFTRFVEHHFANEIAGSITGVDRGEIEKAMKAKRTDARGTDARDEPPARPIRGSWAAARSRLRRDEFGAR